MDPRLRTALDASIGWYEDICALHGIATALHDGLWSAVGPPPALHSGVVVVEHPDAGEVVWRDDAGVTCRRWNWRQCLRTRISGSTTSAVFVLDALDPLTEEDVHAAADALTEALLAIDPRAAVRRRVLSRLGADPPR